MINRIIFDFTILRNLLKFGVIAFFLLLYCSTASSQNVIVDYSKSQSETNIASQSTLDLLLRPGATSNEHAKRIAKKTDAKRRPHTKQTKTSKPINQLECDSDSEIHPDYNALMSIYESTNGMFWYNNEGWRQGANGDSCDPCNFNGGTWYGVHCENNRVSRLDFDGIDDGSYETNREGNNLNGPLPEAFGELVELELVLFDYNSLNGSIPKAIGNLQKMRNFSALECDFSGSIPDEIYNLKALTLLCFRENSLSGQLSPLISNLQDLYLLCLDGNDLDGELPPELGELPRLGVLWLDRNDFTGVVPSTLKNLSSLDRFSMGPSLEGDIADFIPENENMSYIFITATQITGNINFFCNFPNIRTLSVSYNQLYGTLSSCFLELSSINRLSARNNNLTGCYPETDITLCDAIETVNLYDNLGLPWNGDFERYCNGEEQRGALCTQPNGQNGQIGSNCECDDAKDCNLSYEINTEFAFRGRRCLIQPAYPGQVKDSEALLVRTPIPKRKYVLEFCENYNPSVFNASVVIREYDIETGKEGDIIYEGDGCNHEFKMPDVVTYDDLVIIITDGSDCSYASKGLENGVPRLKCAVGR